MHVVVVACGAKLAAINLLAVVGPLRQPFGVVVQAGAVRRADRLRRV
jgi:hypothetical protein